MVLGPASHSCPSGASTSSGRGPSMNQESDRVRPGGAPFPLGGTDGPLPRSYSGKPISAARGSSVRRPVVLEQSHPGSGCAASVPGPSGSASLPPLLQDRVCPGRRRVWGLVAGAALPVRGSAAFPAPKKPCQVFQVGVFVQGPREMSGPETRWLMRFTSAALGP